MTHQDLELLARFFIALDQQDLLSEEKFNNIFSEINLRIGAEKLVTEYLISWLVELQPRGSQAAVAEAGLFARSGSDDFDDRRRHHQHQERMTPKIGIDTLITRGFLTEAKRTTLTDGEKCNLDYENIAKLVLDRKLAVDQAMQLTVDQRYNFTNNVCRFISEGQLTVDQAMQLTVDQRYRLNEVDHVSQVISGVGGLTK
ncbi:MAG: hypothetical protein COY58_09250 [Gammaproteobacteria bacterium CG_4_10_14_0_8_um_filter_38_16]|nr:MAG: hypothetical protein COY58_09250 [Gammaproteobacteria bacterium CG_4_10_14_0_8_um_filter_38_16]PJA03562.1 MAG: hypothetical protein COX72_04540 [Gammaproteobacteria bacterium CG_4_10_14_0_2_um_filter_38_22]